ncbi:uncharacterized protein J4E87_008471 [Alternaria ethzedia]|uniref:uncharacterized protein n=1 Tax=Alternaria ethzedia TaxID=181014 RepID=UPI0020C4FD5C|nr:uncharacterized protein J4E87_008471 [Alternaria ethzedia]KAI4617231.1 hypothetical protein J4E87_008471 [Alternaria ethzedia]
MRLINCSTLQLEEFFGTNIPFYAILSHTWGDKEVSFAQFTSGQPLVGSGYQKIVLTCQQAIKDKIGYAWVDTCCIDKSSSAELSEAINSMFAWYQKSVRCYAYLSDVSKPRKDQDFPKSRWFTRGWTLQEMLAPSTVIFYDQQWVDLGCRGDHAEQISEITGIEEGALCTGWGLRFRDNKFGSYCVATRMSWASKRQTTRPEDMAYCLLGIFDINMPLLYGEGHRAFRRLQEEIIRKVDDDSILAWALSPEARDPSGLELIDRDDLYHTTKEVDFLARSPEDFKDCADLSRATEPSTLFTLTNTGLQIQLPLVKFSECTDFHGRTVGALGRVWIGLLGCSTTESGSFLGILLYPYGDENDSSARVVRQRNIYSTVIVSPRVAFGSVSKTLTIAGFNGFQAGRDYDYVTDEQFVVNECKTIRSLGYQLQAFSAWTHYQLGESLRAYLPLWNSEAKILTMTFDDPFNSMFEFGFETSSSGQNPKFTVFVNRTGRGTVREGDIFSDDERLALYNILRDDGPPYDENRVYDKGDVLVHDDEQRRLHISVEVHLKTIGHHHLFGVNVDALGDGFSVEKHRWTLKRKQAR